MNHDYSIVRGMIYSVQPFEDDRAQTDSSIEIRENSEDEMLGLRMVWTAEAYRLGALEAVVPREALHDAARSLAEKIASKSPLALRLAKEALNGIELMEPKRSYRYEQGFTLELYGSPDSQEARDAFVGKRDAKFED